MAFQLSARKTRATLAAAATLGAVVVADADQVQAAEFDQNTATYTIQAGDTLAKIAQDADAKLKELGVAGITYQEIAAANGIKNANKIAVGQKISVKALADAQIAAAEKAKADAVVTSAVEETKVEEAKITLPNLDPDRFKITSDEFAKTSVEMKMAEAKVAPVEGEIATDATAEAATVPAVEEKTPQMSTAADAKTDEVKMCVASVDDVKAECVQAKDSLAASFDARIEAEKNDVTEAEAVVADLRVKLAAAVDNVDIQKAEVAKVEEEKTAKLAEIECEPCKAEEAKKAEPKEEVKAEEKKLDPVKLTHTVVKGDNLCKIADAFDVSAKALAKKNGIKDPQVIFVGKVLDATGLEKVKDGTECDISKPKPVITVDSGKVKKGTTTFKPGKKDSTVKVPDGKKNQCRVVEEFKQPNGIEKFFGGKAKYKYKMVGRECCDVAIKYFDKNKNEWKTLSGGDCRREGGGGDHTPPGKNDDGFTGGCNGGCNGTGTGRDPNGVGNPGGGNTTPGGTQGGAGVGSGAGSQDGQGQGNGATGNDNGGSTSDNNGSQADSDSNSAGQNSNDADSNANGSPFGFNEPKYHPGGINNYPGFNIA